jgi:uncharacterized coiled-coil protein SlyX
MRLMPFFIGTEENRMRRPLHRSRPRSTSRTILSALFTSGLVLLAFIGVAAAPEDLVDDASASATSANSAAEQRLADRVAELEEKVASLQRTIERYERVMEAQAGIIRQLRERIAELEAAEKTPGERDTTGTPPPPPRAPWHTRLSVFEGTVQPPLLDEMRAAPDVTVIPIFSHVHMDPRETGSIDVARFRRFIPTKIPDPGYDGPVCLDLEGPYTRGLQASTGSREWVHTVAQMALAADVLREMRPRVKISFWGVPFIWWFRGDKSWPDVEPEIRQRVIEHWSAAKPLIERIDWFTPGLYDHYPVKYMPAEDARAEGGAEWCISVCRAMKPGVPVLPSISPRTHDTGHPWYLELLPEEELISDQLEPALEYADGFVWWGADRYYYARGAIPRSEIAPGLSVSAAWRQHFLPLHRRQYQLFRAMANRARRSPQER